MFKRSILTVVGVALLLGTPSFALDQEVQFDAAAIAAVVADVDQFNADLAAAGFTQRLDYPWFFVVGQGTDPFGRLRTGAKWTIDAPGYIIDASDLTTDVAASAADAALVSAFDSWNNIANSNLVAVREPDPGTNMDVLDGTIIGGNCLSIFDFTSPNFPFPFTQIFPESDIVVGGWIDQDYFSKCLGSANIIGVTWTFSDVDSDGDNYRDRLYVEQYYNPAFTWVTSGSTFLDGSSGVDIETIAVHENGHAHGLGHFGGPINNQPFALQPNGKVFNPEAVMNPFYLFGEDRAPQPTDVAGMRTMYSGN